MKTLPEGATALDFAFSIHSDLGCTCRSVKINNRLVPIFHKLSEGDQLEIITDKNQKPTEDWLQNVVTSKAKNRIRAALKEEKKVQADFGKEILERKMNNLKVSFEENCDMLARWYGFLNRTEFLSAIYLNQVDVRKINRKFKADGNLLVEIEPPKPRLQETPVFKKTNRKSSRKSLSTTNPEVITSIHLPPVAIPYRAMISSRLC